MAASKALRKTTRLWEVTIWGHHTPGHTDLRRAHMERKAEALAAYAARLDEEADRPNDHLYFSWSSTRSDGSGYIGS